MLFKRSVPKFRMSLLNPSAQILYISTKINILSIHPYDGSTKILFPSRAILEYTHFCDSNLNLQPVNINVTYHLKMRVDPNLTQLNILSLMNFYIKKLILTLFLLRVLFPSYVPV